MLVRLGRGTDGDGVSFVRLSTLPNNLVYMHQEKEVTERDVKEKSYLRVVLMSQGARLKH